MTNASAPSPVTEVVSLNFCSLGLPVPKSYPPSTYISVPAGISSSNSNAPVLSVVVSGSFSSLIPSPSKSTQTVAPTK